MISSIPKNGFQYQCQIHRFCLGKKLFTYVYMQTYIYIFIYIMVSEPSIGIPNSIFGLMLIAFQKKKSSSYANICIVVRMERVVFKKEACLGSNRKSAEVYLLCLYPPRKLYTLVMPAPHCPKVESQWITKYEILKFLFEFYL